MDTFTALLILAICGMVESEPLSAALVQRRDASQSYASEHARYEPLMFAALPLHAPLPVLRVLSPAPLRARRQPAPAPPSPPDHDYEDEPPRAKHPAAAALRPRPRPLYSAPAAPDTDYEETYEYSRHTFPPRTRPRPAAAAPADDLLDYDSYAPHAAYSSYSPVTYDSLLASSHEAGILYARPSPTGGYTYRRVNTRSTPPPPPLAPPKTTVKESPYIIKIHKYRIVKDR